MKPKLLLTQIESSLKAVRPELLVLDTLGNLFPGNENDRSQVAPFVSMLYRLALEYDTTVLLLGHPSLNGLTSGRGSVRSPLYFEAQ